MYHTHRRRRLIRKRKKDVTQTASSTARVRRAVEGNWPQASAFQTMWRSSELNWWNHLQIKGPVLCMQGVPPAPISLLYPRPLGLGRSTFPQTYWSGNSRDRPCNLHSSKPSRGFSCRPNIKNYYGGIKKKPKLLWQQNTAVVIT